MRRLLAKLLRSPRTIWRLAVDRALVPLVLRLNGVHFGRDCRFRGQPVVSLCPGALITIGQGVLINSRYDSNPAGIPFPTILAALSRKSFISIGDGTGISGASIVANSAVTIGRRVMIGAGACIWDTDFHPIDPDQRLEHPTLNAACAPVTIHDEAFVGARALVLKGVTVGARAVIGAGAVVTKDVKAGEIVAGNPAGAVGFVHLRKLEVIK